MIRIFYIGADPATDDLLPGVELSYGSAVDVPEALGMRLLGDEVYSQEIRDPVQIEARSPEIVWYEPAPGEELRALTGLGPKTAYVLVELGISRLSDMAMLDEEQILEIAEKVPRVSLKQVHSWVLEAESMEV